MSTSTVIEVFGHILYTFTRGVTEHYNPDEPEFTFESFGYNSLESTEREWYCHPVDDLIYQEYSEREATSLDYLAFCSFDVKITDACSTEETHEAVKQSKYQTIAWKRLRPSPLQTVFQSMYIGALISLLMAIFVGTIFTMELYLYLKTAHNCEYNTVNSTMCLRSNMLTKYLCPSSRKKLVLFFKMIVPISLGLLVVILWAYLVILIQHT